MQAPVCPALLMPEARCVHQLVHHNSWNRQYSDYQILSFIKIIINYFELLIAKMCLIIYEYIDIFLVVTELSRYDDKKDIQETMSFHPLKSQKYKTCRRTKWIVFTENLLLNPAGRKWSLNVGQMLCGFCACKKNANHASSVVYQW